DDGAHGDGGAGDGRFGTTDFVPPGAGVGFLWVSGNVSGTEIVRSDPVPFNFQSLIVNITEDEIPNDNDAPRVQPVDIINLDTARAICVKPDVTVPDTWSYAWDINFSSCLNIPAGGSRTAFLTVYPAWYHAPSLSEAEIVVAFTDDDEGSISASDSARFVRRRSASALAFHAPSPDLVLRPNSSDAISLTLLVKDEEGAPVADGTTVLFTTSNGTLSSGAVAANGPEAEAFDTQQGRITVRLTAGATVGDAMVLASLTTSTQTLTATVTVRIQTPFANQLFLAATPLDLTGDAANQSVVVATVKDNFGAPVAGATVRLGAEGDGQLGLLEGSEVLTRTTNAQGQVQATFTQVMTATGLAPVRAEWVNGGTVVQEARVELMLTADKKVFLPFVRK
ncbi:MAG: hypothetical protein HC853_09150, partial [Anaerolineae bacterium]|nr:hypothetical protein [Anaerolineae bacterium]